MMSTQETVDRNERSQVHCAPQVVPAPSAPNLKPYGKRRTTLLLAIGFQLAVLATMTSVEAYTLTFGQTVLLKSTTVDPWDLFRGDYVTLQFDKLTSVKGSNFQAGDAAYVLARREGAFVVGEQAYHEMPKVDGSHIVMKGTVKYTKPQAHLVGVEYGIERYYVQEKTGSQYDAARTRVAQVAVDSSGHCVLKTVIHSTVDEDYRQPGRG